MQRRMTPHPPITRVLMTLDAVGGIARYTLDLARALGEWRIETLLVGFGPRPSPELERECREMPGVGLAWTDEPLDWMVESEAAYHDCAATLMLLADAWEPDVLHLNVPSQAAALPLGPPVVVSAHSCTATWWTAVRGSPPPAEWDWRMRLHAAGLTRADVVIAPSQSHGVLLSQIYGAMPTLRTIYNATRPCDTPRPEQAFALSVGRWWDEAKNLATLEAAAAQADAPILIAGPLAAPGGESRRPEHVQALGSLSKTEVRDLMLRASVFAAPCRYEPFGLAVLEAASTGAPLVLGDIPTFRELWDGAALFVDPDDPGALADAVDALVEDPDKRCVLGELARSRSQLFAPDRQAAATISAYADAILHARIESVH